MSVFPQAGSIRVQVGTPWPQDIVAREEDFPIVSSTREPRIGVRVGKAWPDIEIEEYREEAQLKRWISGGFSALASVIILIVTIYGWLFSEKVLSDVLRYTMITFFVVILWAIGVKFGNGLEGIMKLIASFKKTLS